MEGPGWIQLDRCGEQKNANSHDDDKSKYLKHDQIVAVADALTVAPQQSASNSGAICSSLKVRQSILSRSSSTVCSVFNAVLYAHRGRSKLSSNCKASILIVPLDRLLNSRTSSGYNAR
jgi:hypothetical protein